MGGVRRLPVRGVERGGCSFERIGKCENTSAVLAFVIVLAFYLARLILAL